MKKILFISIVFLGFVVALGVLAKVDFTPATNPAGHTLALPEKAVQVSANVFYLGTAVDAQSGKTVEGYAIIHYKDKPAKPDHPGKPDKPEKPEKGTTCYGFLAKGAKWKGDVEPWIVNSANSGLKNGFVRGNLAANIDKWETAAGNKDILGDGSSTTETLEADLDSPDNENEVYFGELSPGTIGVTIIWGIFGGPPFQRELVEWDQIYNTYYVWSDNGEAGKMDFENIATHELGHSVGLDDLYNTACSEQTMYGYADYGETKKRSLETGDIAGIKALYK